MTAPRPSARTRAIATALFFVSGACGLVYQVVWVRQFGKVFGNTLHSAALVTAVFLGGLGVGAMLAGWWADRRASDSRACLRAYAWSELGIAASGVLLALVVPRLGGLSASLSAYVQGDAGFWVPSPTTLAFRYAVALAALAPPALLMGGTLTLLIRALVADDLQRAAWRVGLLYGANTAGAALGALAIDLALVPAIGLIRAQLLAACANVVAGLGALLLARSLGRGGAAARNPQTSAATPAARSDTGPAPDETPAEPSLLWMASALLLAGVAAMGLEIVWFRFLSELLGQLRSVFSLLLAVILVGFWLGSMSGGWLHQRLGRPTLLLSASQAAVAATALGALALPDHTGMLAAHATALREAMPSMGPATGAVVELWMNVRAISIVVLVPAFFMGLSFPLANACVQRTASTVGRRAGALYLASTAGNVIGSLLAGFVLLSHVGLLSTALAMGGCAAATLFPLSMAATRDGSFSATARSRLACAALALGSLLAFAGVPSTRLLAAAIPSTERGTRRVLSVSEGDNETIAIAEVPGFYRALFTNGHSMSSTSPRAQRYMRAFAHLPLLSMEKPKSVLVICFGVGNTLHAASLHPTVERLDVADLSRHVLDQAHWFAEDNGSILGDGRVRAFVDDGRHVLSVTPAGTYDLITLEPPPISFSGVASLYSKEFYELARSRLTAGGFLTQWLPAYQVGEAALPLVRAFVDVFPEAVLLSGDGRELLLMGTSGASIALDPAEVERRIHQAPSARADLERIQLAEMIEIAGSFAASARTLRAATRTVPPLTDDRPALEYALRSSLRAPRVPAELFDVSDVKAWCPRCAGTIAGLDAHLRVRREVYASDAFLGGEMGRETRPTPPSDPEGAAAVARSAYLQRLFGGEEYDALMAGQRLLASGAAERAVFSLERAVLGSSNDPDASEALGRAYFARGDLGAAAATLAWTAQLAPQRASAHVALGAVLRAQGRLVEAEGVLRFALELDAYDPEAHYQLAAVLSDLERPGEADVELAATLDLEPDHLRASAALCQRAATAEEREAARPQCETAIAGGALAAPIPANAERP